jgi:hypothetical protein
MMTKIQGNRSPESTVPRELHMLLDGGQAHAPLAVAANDFPAQLRGVVPNGLPYSAWQILEHMRIAQRDILDFSRNEDGSYWPPDAEPPTAHSWESSLSDIREDTKAFEALIEAASEGKLLKPFPWGEGQNLLHEAFLIAAHMSYHTGELIVIRRLLVVWKK